MASDFLVSLGLANLAAAGAVLAVLALRGPARRLFGAGIAYALWLIVPGAMLATLAPARTILVEVSSGRVETAPVILQQAAGVSTALAPTGAVSAAPEAVLNAPQVLFAVWLAGLAASLLLLVIGQRRALARFGRLTDDARDSRIARASIGAAGPALVGVIRPRLVVPHDFEERFDAGEQAMILAHERTHLASGHAALNALAALLKAFNWFNPLIHLGVRYARVDQELACDAAVVARYPNERRTYAHALLKTQLASASLPLGCSWPAGSAGHLEERLLMLAQTTPGRFRLAAGASAVTLLFVGAGCAVWTAKPPEERLVEAPASQDVLRLPAPPSVQMPGYDAQPVPQQSAAPDRTPAPAAADQQMRIVAVKRGLLEVRSANGDKYVRRYYEPGESYPLRMGLGWTVSADDGSAFEWWLGEQMLGPLALAGPVQSQGVDLVPIKMQDAAQTPAQTPSSRQPVLRLNGKTSPVLDGSWAVASGFGDRVDPFNGKTAFHPGLDLAAPFEAAVHAPAQAAVTFAGVRDDGLGRVVELDLGNSTKILLGHLNEIRVKEGDRVKPSDVVGTVGSTGRSSGPHLHLEYLRQGKPFDPATVKGLVLGPAQLQSIGPALIQQEKSAAEPRAPAPLPQEQQIPATATRSQSFDQCEVKWTDTVALMLTGNVVRREGSEVLYAIQVPLLPSQAAGPMKITADRFNLSDDCKSATWTGNVIVELDGVTYTSDAAVAERGDR